MVEHSPQILASEEEATKVSVGFGSACAVGFRQSVVVFLLFISVLIPATLQSFKLNCTLWFIKGKGIENVSGCSGNLEEEVTATS